MNVPTHPFGEIDRHRLAEEPAFIRKMLELARKWPEKLTLLQDFCFTWAGRIAAVEPESPDLLVALRLSCQAGAAILALACHPGQALTLPLGDGPPATLVGTGPDSTTHVGRWLKTFWLAMVCRDLDALHRVLDTPTEVVRASSTRGDEYAYLFVDALRGLWQKDPKLGDKLVAALDATDPEKLENADLDYVLDIAVPAMEVFYRLVQRDGAAFDEALAKALACHRSYWSAEERNDDPDGFIALGPLALAALARDRGLAVEVESGYLPARLIAGAWAD